MNTTNSSIERMLRGKRILVIGGSGSIGQEIVRQILEHEPAAIRIFSRNEHNQYLMSQRLSAHNNVRFFIGDVRDKGRLILAAEGVDVMFHAAALKHVKACEYNPFEAVKTNVIGTQNALDAALAHSIERFISISTDKAVSPTNTMGATKLLAERLVANAANYRGNHRTLFTVVRLGNVLASHGSAIPLFIDQIRNGGPVTLTHPEMKRFFMAAADAVKLCLKAASESEGGDVYVIKMRPLLVADLIDVLVDELAPLFGYDPSRIEVETIGLHPGERISEELITDNEAMCAIELPDYLRIPVSGVLNSIRQLPFNDNSLRTEPQALLTKLEIRQMLSDAGLLEMPSGQLPYRLDIYPL